MHVLKDERGAGILEVLLGIALTATITSALVSLVFTAGKGGDANNSKLPVFRELERAAGSVGDDVSMAKFTNLVDGAPAVNTMTLQWTDYYGGNAVGHQSTYARSGGNLTRTYDGVASTVAKAVTSAGFSLSGRVVTFTLTVADTEGSAQFSQPQTYRFYLTPT